MFCRVTQYGELEMLLAGLELGNLIPLFQEHDVSFEDVLRMSDQDLVKVGHYICHWTKTRLKD